MKITLYIKTHNKTGLKYFGKTSNDRDPEKYAGSGKYWLRHLRKHGKDLSTKILGVFDDPIKCSEFAIKFSRDNNIVESDEWANLREENGQDGAPVGHVGSQPSELSRKIVSKKLKAIWKKNRDKIIKAQKLSWTEERKKEQTDRLKSEFWTEERKASHSNKLTGRPGHTKCRGVPKHEGFGELISKALTGKPKATKHLTSLRLSRQKDKRTFVDHNGIKYRLHSDFSDRYDVAMNTFRDLDAVICRETPVYKKLGIDYKFAKNKTKRELGFRFE